MRGFEDLGVAFAGRVSLETPLPLSPVESSGVGVTDPEELEDLFGGMSVLDICNLGLGNVQEMVVMKE